MLYRLLIDVTREDGRDFPSVKHAITTGDKIPATSLAGAARPVPERPLLQHLRLHGDERQPDPRVRGPGRRRACRRTSRSASRCPASRTLIQDRGRRVRSTGAGTGELLVWTPFQTRGYLNAALNEGRFASHPEAGDGETTYYRTGDIVRRHDDGVAHARGPRRLLRQGPRRPGQHPGGRAGDPGAPRRDRGRRRGRAGRARREARCTRSLRREPDSKLNSLTLRKHCAERLARTEMPSTIEIVTEPLPKTSTG